MRILVCDVCDRQIGTPDGAMFYWVAFADGVVTSAKLAHKRCDDHDPAAQSLELAWLSDPAEALQRVAELAVRYAFTSQQLGQLVIVAWAVASTATPEQAEHARRLSARMRGE
jgi:hypothetical protein